MRAFLRRREADPGFRRAALAFPPTRPIARARAAALFDLSAGFVYSQVLAAFVALDLPARLARGPVDAATLAGSVAPPLAPARLERLLEAACALRLARRVASGAPGRYGLGPLGAALVDNPGVQAMIAHHALLYEDLRDPVALLRGPAAPTALARFWRYADGAGGRTAGAYSALMSLSSELVADELLAACDLRRARHLLDAGGGDGTLALRLARRWRRLRIETADLAPVAAIAARRLARSPLSRRLSSRALDLLAGDWRSEAQRAGAAPLPDVIVLCRVLHDHDDDRVRTLLGHARAALAPGGRLIVAEPMAPDADGAASGGIRDRVARAYFGPYLLAMGSGRARSAVELGGLLRGAGFAAVARLRTRDTAMAGLLVAS